MRRIGQADIDALRRRIQSIQHGTLAPAGRQPAPAGTRGRRPPPNVGAKPGIEGAEHATELGRFLLQEQFYPNQQPYGNLQIKCLQNMPSNAVPAISGAPVRAADPKQWVFLDTETTGLAGGTGTCAFLVGIGTIEDDGLRVRLYFMRDFDEERAMLDALARTLADYGAVITYNGKTFDVPLLETRYRLKRLCNPFRDMDHVDLLPPARRLWKDRLGSCRLTRLESALLEFERRGDIPGSLIPQRYFDYLRSGDGSSLSAIFRHNSLDIVSLACLSSVLLSILSTPDQAGLHHGQDLRALARWLQQLGKRPQSLALYRKAIRSGLPPRDLGAALWETAQLERRVGQHDRQVQLLYDLTRASARHRAAAFVELAKHYEHRRKDYRLALQMTLSAQRDAPSPELCHREQRIRRKLSATAKSDQALLTASAG